jgi:uncharacterized damage-inducible protein DinB
MTSADLLSDAFGRIREIVEEVLDGASTDELTFRPDGKSNSIAWLVWHLTRVQDDHVAEVAGKEQAWTSSGWAERFALRLDVADTGYGHDPDQVAMVSADAEKLLGYHDAACANTLEFVRHLTDADLDRVVDKRWDPPVTLGVRLVSVISDDLQHAGQASYLRGLLQRRG